MRKTDNGAYQIEPFNISKLIESASYLLNEISSTEINRGIAIAIVDIYGELLVFAAHPHCYPLPRKVAIRKAYTAAILRRGTDLVEQEVKKGTLNLIALNDINLIALPGGIPIECNDKFWGGIGVSGLSAQEDLMIAQQIMDKINSF